MRCRPLHVVLCIALFASLASPLLLCHAFVQDGYLLSDSAAVQRLPDRQGGILGMKTAVPQTVVLPDGTSIVVYRVERIDMRLRPPLGVGDVLYAVNGVLFTSIDGMPRYVQSLVPGSTATVEYLQAPPRRWRAVPVEQRPSLLATVQIISIPSRYARPPGPPPSPEQIARERMHIAKMAAFGFAVGSAIQAVLDALGGGPDLAGPIFAPPRFQPKSGLTEYQQNLKKEPDKPKEEPPGPYEAPAIYLLHDVGPTK